MGMTSPEPDPIDDITKAMATFRAGMDAIESSEVFRALAGAYRDKLINEVNFSKDQAEVMAVQYHQFVLEATMISLRKQAGG